MHDLPCKRIQADEIWSFIFCKREKVRFAKKATIDCGDCWTWTAICADTKMIVSFMVGDRSSRSCRTFLEDLKARVSGRFQLTSDAWRPYKLMVEAVFSDEIDYAQLDKIYGPDPAAEKRYSPPQCVGTKRTVISGSPDPKHISTSYVERQNLTMRMHMRRFTRLTNGFSKKIENHACAIALHMMFYNFVRIHQTLRVTPAMAAGVTTRLWEMTDIVELVEAWEVVGETVERRHQLSTP